MKELKSKGLGLAVISYDSPEILTAFGKQRGIAGANPRMAGIAFPGTFMLDRSGRVKSRFFEDFYITRNTVSSILARTGTGNPVAGTKISTEHLEVTAYPSDAAIAPGNRITLTFDIVPHRGIHVYAPGASSYRVSIKRAMRRSASIRNPFRYRGRSHFVGSSWSGRR